MTIEQIMDSLFVCPSGCWLWTGPDSGEGRGGGYGRVHFEGRKQATHRVIFKKFKGPIPEGWHVDHLCARRSNAPWTNRRCGNPDHLEAVPDSEHARRARHGSYR